MPIPDPQNPSPSNTEKYLSQLVEIERQNQQLLENLVKMEQKKSRSRWWDLLWKILLALLPYFITISIVWYMYMQMQTMVTSIETKIDNLVPDISIEETSQDIKEKYWDNSSIKKFFFDEEV